MKKKLSHIWLTFCLTLMGNQVYGQSPIFHFIDTTTVIAVSTSQSPAHWYIEIYNDAGQDTLLRWKVRFENIPTTWNINFDDQHTNHPVVLDGDSSDLVLLQDVFGAQKLIIGAETNQTPGWGIVYFDIFNPYNRSEKQTIEYHFHIGTAEINELLNQPTFLFENGTLHLADNQLFSIQFVDETGKEIKSLHQLASFSSSAIPDRTFLMIVQGQNKHLIWKTLP